MEEYVKTILTEEDQAWLNSTYDKLLVKMKRECERVGTMIPYSPRDGKYHDLDFGTTGKEAEKDGKSPLLCYWTNGFWPGMLWQMYQTTGDEAYRTTAEGVEARIMSNLVQIDLAGHDIGFVLLPSAVANYRKTGNPESRKNALIAAQTLAGRYNSAGRYIRAWNDSEMMEKMMGGGVPLSGWMIIDCLMNIPMLFWASETTKDPRYAQIALNHAKTAQQYIARGDGSSNHIVRFDPATGEFVDAPGGQGYGVGSAWSRGQSWALYGFALAYRHTQDESFLTTAKRAAHYVISSMAVNDWLPLVDYRAPAEPVKYDTTSSMISACGLLEIAEHVPEHEKRLYVQAALKMLRACDRKFCNWDPEVDSIVDGGTYFYHDPDGSNTEVPIIYSDYYLIEALLRLGGDSLFIW